MAKKPNPRPSENGGHRGPKGGRAPLLDHIKFALICERYAETGLAYKSCEELGFEYGTVQGAIKSMTNAGDDSWVELWTESYDKFRESLEAAIITRGRDGTPTKWKVSPSGERVPIEWEYSDRLLELAAKGHFPERYRERIHLSGQVGLEPVDAFANLSVKAKREIRAIIMRDLEEQRELAASKAAPEVLEHVASDAIEDMRGREDDQ